MTSGDGWSVLESRHVHSVFARQDAAGPVTRVGYQIISAYFHEIKIYKDRLVIPQLMGIVEY